MSIYKHFSLIYTISLAVLFSSSLSVLSAFTCPNSCICTKSKGLSNCTSLQLSMIPSNISHETTSLLLGDNQLSNITWQNFENLGLLKELNLRKNGIREITNAPFRHLANLTKLILRYNEITTLSADSFQGLTSLQLLSLHNNKLVSFPENLYMYTPNLKRLNLGSNEISVIGKNSWNMLALVRVWLANNRIHKIEIDAFSNCSQLAYLDLKNNALVNLTHELMSSTFGNLVHLDLSENLISNVSGDAFLYLRKLSELHLEFNPLDSLPCGVFDSLKKMKIITLRQKSMEDIAANGLNCTNHWFKVFQRQYHIEQMRVGEPSDGDRPITIRDASKQ